MGLSTKTTETEQTNESTLKSVDNNEMTRKIMRRVSIENKGNNDSNGASPAAHQKQPYYSINAMVSQKEIECWDNGNTHQTSNKMPSTSIAKTHRPQQQKQQQKQKQRAPKKLSAEFNISLIDEQHSSPGVRCTTAPISSPPVRSNSSRSIMMSSSRHQSSSSVIASSRMTPPKSILRRATSERITSITTPSVSAAAPSPACSTATASACRTSSAIKSTQIVSSNRDLVSNVTTPQQITTRPNLTKQQSNQSVHFPPSSSIITATHVRPRTNSDEVPELYYSNQDIRRNKRERALRQLNEKKAKIVAEQKEALKNGTLFATSSSMSGTTAATSSTTGNSTASSTKQKEKLPHDNSFWRTKVGRRWQKKSSPSDASNASPVPSPSCMPENIDGSYQRKIGTVLVPFSDYGDDVSITTDVAVTTSQDGAASPKAPGTHQDCEFSIPGTDIVVPSEPTPAYHQERQSQVPTSQAASLSRSGTIPHQAAARSSQASFKKQCNATMHLMDTLYLF